MLNLFLFCFYFLWMILSAPYSPVKQLTPVPVTTEKNEEHKLWDSNSKTTKPELIWEEHTAPSSGQYEDYGFNIIRCGFKYFHILSFLRVWKGISWGEYNSECMKIFFAYYMIFIFDTCSIKAGLIIMMSVFECDAWWQSDCLKENQC